MFCSKCGKELPDDSVFCNACGHQISEPTETEPMVEKDPKAPKNKKKEKSANKKALKKAAIISGAVLGVLVVLGIVVFLIIPSIAHSKAEKLYNNGQYVEAYQAYIDAYRKPMNGFVEEEKITNCGFAVIDEFIKNGDAEGAFRFIHKYSKDSTEEGGWIINDIAHRLTDRNPNVITDTTIQEKLCTNILEIISNGKYCVFDKYYKNAYTDEYMLKYDILLLNYLLSALPTDYNLPTQIYGRLLQSYAVCSDYYNEYQMNRMFPKENVNIYLKGFANSCDLDNQLINSGKDQWLSKYEIPSSEISSTQIKYETIESASSINSFTITGVSIFTYDEHTYSANFSISYKWDDTNKRYKEEVYIGGPFYGCNANGKVGKYTFSNRVSFTHFTGYGQSKVVLEFDGNTLRQKTYGYYGTLVDTDTATYSLTVTPTTYTIDVTANNGFETTMWYYVNGNFIAWGEDVYIETN